MCNTQASGQQKGPNTDTSLSRPHCQNKPWGSQQCPQQLSTAAAQTQIQYSFLLQGCNDTRKVKYSIISQKQQHVL